MQYNGVASYNEFEFCVPFKLFSICFCVPHILKGLHYVFVDARVPLLDGPLSFLQCIGQDELFAFRSLFLCKPENVVEGPIVDGMEAMICGLFFLMLRILITLLWSMLFALMTLWALLFYLVFRDVNKATHLAILENRTSIIQVKNLIESIRK